MKIKKRQAGFGLLELMLSMVIVALLLIMATRYYQSARSNARVNQAVSLVGTMVSAANNISLGSGTYTNVTVDSLYHYMPISAQGTSGSGSKATNAITSPWQTPVTVTPSATNFAISFTLPSDDCFKLGDALGGQGNKDGSVVIDTGACTASSGGNGTLKITENLVNS